MNREDAEKKIIELSQWRCTTKLCEGRISCHQCKEERLKEAMEVIEALQEKSKGRWIKEPPYIAIGGAYKKGVECSECHSYFVSDGNTPYNLHPYCCECGAEMER